MHNPIESSARRTLVPGYRLTAFVVAVTMLGCQENPVDPVDNAFSPVERILEGPNLASYKVLSLGLCATDQHAFTNVIDQPMYPMPVGRQWDYRGIDEGSPVRLLATVLDRTEDVGNVSTRVLQEQHWDDGQLVEESWNYVAQTEEGTICYFGEIVDNYVDGVIDNHNGSWRADDSGNGPGILMPTATQVGVSFQQENAPGIAEDSATIIARGESVSVPFGTFSRTIRTEDVNPLDGDRGEKVYARGIGLLVDGAVRLERMRP